MPSLSLRTDLPTVARPPLRCGLRGSSPPQVGNSLQLRRRAYRSLRSLRSTAALGAACSQICVGAHPRARPPSRYGRYGRYGPAAYPRTRRACAAWLLPEEAPVIGLFIDESEAASRAIPYRSNGLLSSTLALLPSRQFSS